MILAATICGFLSLVPALSAPAPLPHAFDRPIADITVTAGEGSLQLTLMMNFQFLDLTLATKGAPDRVPEQKEIAQVRDALVAAFRSGPMLRAGGAAVPFEAGDFEISPPSAALRAREPQLARLLTQVRFTLRVPKPPVAPVQLHWEWYPEHALYPVPNSPVAPMKVSAVVVREKSKPRVLQFHTEQRVQTIWTPAAASSDAMPVAEVPVSGVPVAEPAAPSSPPSPETWAAAPVASSLAAGESATESRFPWWAIALGGLGIALMIPLARSRLRGAVALWACAGCAFLSGCGETEPAGASCCDCVLTGLARQVVSKPMTLSGESKSYSVTAKTADGTIPLNEPFVLDVTLAAKPGAAPIEAVQVNADMPAHGHGMNTKPRITALGGGKWRAEGMLFHMPGEWEVYVYVGEGQTMERIALPAKL